MAVDHAHIAAAERGERHGFRGREGDVAARTVEQLAVAVAAAERAPGAVGYLALENRPEGLRIDGSFEPELAGAPAGP